MRMKAIIALALVLVSLAAVVQFSEEADATEGDVIYCYTEDISFFYQGGTQDPDSVEWEVTGLSDGQVIDIDTVEVEGDDWWTVRLDRTDVSECSEIYVTQTVWKDGSAATENNTYIPVRHLEQEELLYVTFFDGYSDTVLDVKTISSSTTVRSGDDFVEVPDVPTRDGHSFLGWYTEDGQRFDPKKPIAEDTNLYARWAETGAGSVIVTEKVGIHIVTFISPPGIHHEVLEIAGDSLHFTLGLQDGFYYNWETLNVVSDRGSISMGDDDVFVLSGIDGDTVVHVTADRLYRVLLEMDNVLIDTATAMPGGVAQGPFDARLVAEDGYRITSVSVYMGDTDVTDLYLDGDRISITELTGDLRIVAHADPVDDGGFPWIYLVIALIVIVLILAFALWRRSRSSDDGESRP